MCTSSGRSIGTGCGDGGDGDKAEDRTAHNRQHAIVAFLDAPKLKSNPNTLHAYAGVLDRTADQLDADRNWADVADVEIGDALTELWGETMPATWNRNRSAVGSWLA
ncbi:hypothetical protein IU459_35195 [Nocardia amamiensis]|uniref:Uncharacterized protein n=1 Tax=Nocardia amamiensis TaxID=404578 RepID=A0ABS0D1N8_9NOCA|nr:hypothetical protein [Nocardia amamiensis]MBF6302742.1 hypothetical protein [Nocardia amamiensis]